MKRPKIIAPCVADRYVHDKRRERIAEFSFPGTDGPAGGLISLRQRDDGPPIVELYRVEGCEVRTEREQQLAEALRHLCVSACDARRGYADRDLHEPWPETRKRAKETLLAYDPALATELS